MILSYADGITILFFGAGLVLQRYQRISSKIGWVLIFFAGVIFIVNNKIISRLHDELRFAADAPLTLILLLLLGLLIGYFAGYRKYKLPEKRRKISKKQSLRAISLISLGERIRSDEKGPLHNGSVYVSRSMRKLRNGALSLFRDIGYDDDDPVYNEVLNAPDIGHHLGPRELYATKRDFIDLHIEALSVMLEQLTKNHPTMQ